ncbi:MAG: hypothetical protein WC707_02050 [Candidatus Babeliaceae bacterium]
MIFHKSVLYAVIISSSMSPLCSFEWSDYKAPLFLCGLGFSSMIVGMYFDFKSSGIKQELKQKRKSGTSNFQEIEVLEREEDMYVAKTAGCIFFGLTCLGGAAYLCKAHNDYMRFGPYKP